MPSLQTSRLQAVPPSPMAEANHTIAIIKFAGALSVYLSSLLSLSSRLSLSKPRSTQVQLELNSVKKFEPGLNLGLISIKRKESSNLSSSLSLCVSITNVAVDHCRDGVIAHGILLPRLPIPRSSWSRRADLENLVYACNTHHIILRTTFLLISSW